MNKEKKDIKNSFPKGFFEVSRPKVTLKEVLQDVTPIKWEKKSKKTLVYSPKENKQF